MALEFYYENYFDDFFDSLFIITGVSASVPQPTVAHQPIYPAYLPIDLRIDNGVLINANDPAQLAAHPNARSATTGSRDTRTVDDSAIKLASPIGGRIVRDINDAKRVK